MHYLHACRHRAKQNNIITVWYCEKKNYHVEMFADLQSKELCIPPRRSRTQSSKSICDSKCGASTIILRYKCALARGVIFRETSRECLGEGNLWEYAIADFGDMFVHVLRHKRQHYPIQRRPIFVHEFASSVIWKWKFQRNC